MTITEEMIAAAVEAFWSRKGVAKAIATAEARGYAEGRAAALAGIRALLETLELRAHKAGAREAEAALYDARLRVSDAERGKEADHG
jgi:hypothetical protein